MGETNEEWEARVEERSHTHTWHMDEMTRTNTWANDVWDIIMTADKHEKKGDVWGVLFTQSVFSKQWIDVRQSRSGRSYFNTIWKQKQVRGVQKYLENSPKYNLLVQFEARWKKRIAVLSNPIARNRSFQHTTCERYLESCSSWRLEKIKTAKYTNSQGYRESYSRQTCNMDVRILLMPKRENPPTIKANKAWSTGKPIAHISRTHVQSEIQRNLSR